MFVRKELALWGLALWLAGTAVVRLVGHKLLHPGGGARLVLLFAGSLPAAAWLVRGLCRRAGLPREHWPAGAIVLLWPTLLLDPFASALFPAVFPNVAPQMAGVFGGWMLWCCAGGLLGTLPVRRRP
jgi:hypothetical protein